MPTSVALPLSMPTFVTFKDGQFWAKASMPAYVPMRTYPDISSCLAKASMPTSVTLPHPFNHMVVSNVQILAKASMPASVALPQLST